MFVISPSILAASFGCISQEINNVVKAGVSSIHLDVMDGSFVPNITFGSQAVKDFVKPPNVVFDAHLMIQNPEKHIESFVKAGVDIISVHPESTLHLHRLIQQIHSYGTLASVALNPATPLSVLDYVYEDLDMILIMSVNPGWGGQSCIPSTIQKVADLKSELINRQLDIPIQVDGGVNSDTIIDFAQAGATNFVAGSAVFGKGNSSVDVYKKNIDSLLSQLESL